MTPREPDRHVILAGRAFVVERAGREAWIFCAKTGARLAIVQSGGTIGLPDQSKNGVALERVADAAGIAITTRDNTNRET